MTFARNNRSKWIVVAFSMVAAMALMGAGCAGDEDCTGDECSSSSIETPPDEGTCRLVCERLYGGCGSFPPDENMKGACRLSCADGAFEKDTVQCLSSVSCDKTEIQQCLDDEPGQRDPSENP